MFIYVGEKNKHMKKVLIAMTLFAFAPLANAGILGTDLVRWAQDGGNVYYLHSIGKQDALKLGVSQGEADLGVRHYFGRYGQSIFIHGGLLAGNVFDLYVQAGYETFLSKHFQVGVGGYATMNGGSNAVVTIAFSF